MKSAEDEWLDNHVVSVREKWQSERLQLNKELLSVRAIQPLPYRLRLLEDMIFYMVDHPAPQLGRSSPSAEQALPRGFGSETRFIGHLSPEETREHLIAIKKAIEAIERAAGLKPYGSLAERFSKAYSVRDDLKPVNHQGLVKVIETHVEALEAAYDAQRGFIKPTSGDKEISAEKDKRILTDFVGFSPDEVSRLEPTLGSPTVIRRVRKAHGQKPSDGTALEQR